MIFHLPLWKTTITEKIERLYLRVEFQLWKPWASGGRLSNGKLKIYRRSIRPILDIGWTVGKCDYSTINED